MVYDLQGKKYAVADIAEVMPDIKGRIPQSSDAEKRKVCVVQCNNCVYMFFRAISETYYNYKKPIIVGFNLTEWQKAVDWANESEQGNLGMLDPEIGEGICGSAVFFDETDTIEEFSSLYGYIPAFSPHEGESVEVASELKGRWTLMLSDFFVMKTPRFLCDKEIFEAIKQGVAELPTETDLLWYLDSIFIGETEVCSVSFHSMYLVELAIKAAITQAEIFVGNPDMQCTTEERRGYYINDTELASLLMKLIDDVYIPYGITYWNFDEGKKENFIHQALIPEMGYVGMSYEASGFHDVTDGVISPAQYLRELVYGDTSDEYEEIEDTVKEGLGDTTEADWHVAPEELWTPTLRCAYRENQIVQGQYVCSNKTGKSWNWADEDTYYVPIRGKWLTLWAKLLHE